MVCLDGKHLISAQGQGSHLKCQQTSQLIVIVNWRSGFAWFAIWWSCAAWAVDRTQHHRFQILCGRLLRRWRTHATRNRMDWSLDQRHQVRIRQSVRRKVLFDRSCAAELETEPTSSGSDLTFSSIGCAMNANCQGGSEVGETLSRRGGRVERTNVCGVGCCFVMYDVANDTSYRLFRDWRRLQLGTTRDELQWCPMCNYGVVGPPLRSGGVCEGSHRDTLPTWGPPTPRRESFRMSLLALFMCLAEVAIMDSVNGLLGVGMCICLCCKLFYFFCFLLSGWIFIPVLIGPWWCHAISLVHAWQPSWIMGDRFINIQSCSGQGSVDLWPTWCKELMLYKGLIKML